MLACPGLFPAVTLNMDSALKRPVPQRGKNKDANDAVRKQNREKAWRTHAGIWRENPEFEAFVKEIEKNRGEVNPAKAKPSCP